MKMGFKVVQPCKHCPFRRDCLPEWLGQARAEQIARSMTHNNHTFPCHETTRAGGARPGQAQMCAGAALMVERTETANALLQIAERFQLFDPTRLHGRELVFPTWAAFVAHHSRKAERVQNAVSEPPNAKGRTEQTDQESPAAIYPFPAPPAKRRSTKKPLTP